MHLGAGPTLAGGGCRVEVSAESRGGSVWDERRSTFVGIGDLWVHMSEAPDEQVFWRNRLHLDGGNLASGPFEDTERGGKVGLEGSLQRPDSAREVVFAAVELGTGCKLVRGWVGWW